MENGFRETKAVAVMFAIICGYALVVLATGQVNLIAFAELLGMYVGTAFSIFLVAALASLFVLLVRNRPSKQANPEDAPSPTRVIKSWLKERRARDGFLSLLWPPMLFAMLMTTFNAFKQQVLGPQGFHYDVMFADWDKALFLGHDPWTVTHAIFNQPWMTAAMDAAYHGWFVPMSIGVAACAFLPDTTFRLRTQYLLTYIGIWIFIGSFLAILTPSAGPCFYNDYVGHSQSFADLMTRLQSQASGYGAEDLGFIMSQGHLRAAHGSLDLMPGGGISAMPSVHNGLSALFAIAGFRIGRKTGWVMTGYAVLIWIASIHLGWHYALDGIVAAAVTVGLWKAAGWLVNRIDTAPASSHLQALA